MSICCGFGTDSVREWVAAGSFVYRVNQVSGWMNYFDIQIRFTYNIIQVSFYISLCIELFLNGSIDWKFPLTSKNIIGEL